tara:strand:+ start:2073 stop:2354 length:282 start_codon:yes stop_codon:yes gene_type:complete
MVIYSYYYTSGWYRSWILSYQIFHAKTRKVGDDMDYNIARIIEDDSIQLQLPFPEMSNIHPLDKKMKRIYPKFIVTSKNKLCQKGDNNDKSSR